VDVVRRQVLELKNVWRRVDFIKKTWKCDVFEGARWDERDMPDPRPVRWAMKVMSAAQRKEKGKSGGLLINEGAKPI